MWVQQALVKWQSEVVLVRMCVYRYDHKQV